MRCRFLLLLLVLSLLIVPAAAEIIFTCPSQEFSVDPGESISLKLGVDQNTGSDIQGKLTINEIRISGTSVFRESRITDRTVFSDASSFPVNIPAISEGDELVVNLVFTYTDASGTMRDVTLPPVTIRTGPITGQLSPIRSAESIHVVKPSVSSGSGTTADPSSQIAGSVISNSADQLPDLSLNLTENHDEEFTSHLRTLPEFTFLEESITSYGFLVSKTFVTSSASDAGTFSIGYRNANGNEAEIAGNVSGPLFSASSLTDAPAGIPLILKKDTRYLSAVSEVNAEGYLHTGTMSDVHDGDVVIVVHLENPEGKAAEITAHLNNGGVTSVETSFETDLFSPWMIIALLLTTGILILFYWNRRRLSVISLPSSPKIDGASNISLADEYLLCAKAAFEKGLYQDASAYAGKSLRYFLTGDREVTTDELLSRDISPRAADLLLRCRDAGFSHREIEKQWAEKIINEVEKYISYDYNN